MSEPITFADRLAGRTFTTDVGDDHRPPPQPGPKAAPAPIAERFPAFCFRLRASTPPADLVPELVPKGLTMLHGQPRAKKSWAAQEIARATSTGTAAFALDQFTVAGPRETWFLTEEDPEWEVQQRFSCLFAGRQNGEPETLHISVQKTISFDVPKWQRRTIEYARDCRIEVTIIDPIRAVSAAVDQGPRELKPLAAFLREFIRQTGSAVVLVHHDVKPFAGRPDDRARPQRASGGGIFSIADAPIHAELFGETDGQTLLSPAQYKFSVAPSPFLMTLSADHPKRPKWVRLTGESTTSAAAAELLLHQKIRDYLCEHPATSGSKLASAIHANKGRTLEALEALFARGVVDSFQKGQAKLWRVVTTGQSASVQGEPSS